MTRSKEILRQQGTTSTAPTQGEILNATERSKSLLALPKMDARYVSEGLLLQSAAFLLQAKNPSVLGHVQVARLLGKSENYVRKAEADETYIGASGWRIIELAIGYPIYRLWMEALSNQEENQ
jgi:hypothetical protein